MKITAMPICPIHHRRNAKTPIEPVFFKGWSFEHLVFAPLSQPKKTSYLSGSKISAWLNFCNQL
jgi:hypothetical protein